MKQLLCISIVFFSMSIKSQEKQIIDTILVRNDSVVVYNNKSWEYLNMLNFNGILNEPLSQLMLKELGDKFYHSWNNNEPYTMNNNLSTLKDSIWLCVIDEKHPKFCIPNN